MFSRHVAFKRFAVRKLKLTQCYLANWKYDHSLIYYLSAESAMHSLYNMIVIFPTYLVFLELACRMRVKGIRVYYSLLCFSFTHLILRCPCSSLCVLYIVHIYYIIHKIMFCILTRVFQFHVFISTTLLLYIRDIYVLHIIQVVFNVFSIIMCITDSVLLK